MNIRKTMREMIMENEIHIRTISFNRGHVLFLAIITLGTFLE